MAVDPNNPESARESAEDGLSALRRLAALDNAQSPSGQGAASQSEDVVEAIPDWLELLLAKYGEQASFLAGIRPGTGRLRPGSLDREAPSQVASLLEQMAAEAEGQRPSERLSTSVDWGERAEPQERREEEEAPEWRSQTPAPAASEEEPDWLSEISRLPPQAETPAEAPSPIDLDEAPDWLQEVPPTPQPGAASRPGESAPPEAAQPEEEVPDWLRELQSTPQPPAEMPAPPAAETPPGSAEAEEADVPDWLARLAAVSAPEGAPAGEPEPQELAEAAPSEPEAEVPDWLRALGGAAEGPMGEPAPQQPAEAVPSEAEAEVPDWLSGLGAAAEAPTFEPAPPEPAAQVPTESEAEMPDWLRALDVADEARGIPSGVPEPAEEAAGEPEAEVPEWVRELEEAEETPAVELPQVDLATEMSAKAEEEMPDWVHELEEAGESFESEPEVPDWLATLRGEERTPLEMMEEEEAPPAEYQPGELAEAPDWLAELRMSGKQDAFELQEEVVEAEEESLPDWLAELRASQAPAEMIPSEPAVAEAAPEPVEVEAEEYLLPEAEAAGEEPELPTPEVEYTAAEEASPLDWLAEIEAEAAEEEAPLAEEAETPESGRETIQSQPPFKWLISLEDQEERAVLPTAEEAAPVEEARQPAESVGPGEVADWLIRLRPEERPEEARREEPVEAGGVLAGIPGLLPIAEEALEGEEEPMAIWRSRTGVPVVPDVEGAELFREIAAEPSAKSLERVGEEEAIEAKPRRRRIVETLAWTLVFIILVAAIVLTLIVVLDRVGDLLGGPAFGEFLGSPLVIDPAPVNTFRAEVTKLPPDAVVLVSFDYSPATEAEMGPLAEIIVRDLLASQARVVAVSLRPEGGAIAQRVLNGFESEYPSGQRTINLGYLPGQTAGVRSLAFLSSMPLFQDSRQTLKNYPAWQDVGGLQEVALIVVVADSPPVVRWWVEQLGPGTSVNRAMVAAVSRSALPSVRPYYNQIDPKSGQLLGLLSGVTDAAAYENRLGQPDRAVHSLAAQSIAHLGVVMVGLGGAVVGFRTQAVRHRE